MPARYIIAFVEFIPSMNRNVMVIELWEGSTRVESRYQDPKNYEIIQEIQNLYITKGLGAVKDFDRKRWNFNRKTVDTTS